MFKIINKPNRILSFASQSTGPRPRFLPSTFRLSTFGLLLTFNLSLLTIQCGLDIEDPTPPSPPVWVQKSLPEEWPERGIDAHETGGIYLEWELNPEQVISAYLIYRAEFFQENDSMGKYGLLYRLETDIVSDLNYLDSDAISGIHYYYKLKAEDNSGNHSRFSNSLDFTLLPQIQIATMIPNGISDSLNSDRELFWSYRYGIEMEDYCITILESNGNSVYRRLFSPGNYVSGIESKEIPASTTFESGKVYKWRIDTGARYINGLETFASESAWANFIYVGE